MHVDGQTEVKMKILRSEMGYFSLEHRGHQAANQHWCYENSHTTDEFTDR